MDLPPFPCYHGKSISGPHLPRANVSQVDKIHRFPNHGPVNSPPLLLLFGEKRGVTSETASCSQWQKGKPLKEERRAWWERGHGTVTGTSLGCERQGWADTNREDAGRVLRAAACTVNTGQRKDMSKSPLADEETMGKTDRYEAPPAAPAQLSMDRNRK